MKKSIFTTIIVLAITFISISNILAKSYEFADLGTIPPKTHSYGYDLNDYEQAVGHLSDSALSGTPITDYDGFLYDSGTKTNLKSHGLNKAQGINNSGQIVGFDEFDSYIYQSGSSTSIGNLGGSWTEAYDINNSGYVVGGSDTSSYMPHAYIYHTSTGMQDIGPSGSGSSARAINNSNNVAGTIYGSTTSAFIWNNSTGITTLNDLGGNNSYAFGINNLNQVVGESETASLSTHAFVWNSDGTAGGVMTDLGTLDSTGYSKAFDINDYEQIVGESNGKAVLWENGLIYDLNDFLPTGSTWDLISARAINENGSIVGTGMFNGVFRAFMLKSEPPSPPVPEPLTIILLGLGLIGIIKKKF